jgi:ribose 5-phosphate isomerase RpiB
MFFTARQLQDLHRAGGSVTLPYRARLTPLAADWVKSKGIAIGYAEGEAKEAHQKSADNALSRYLWWCDGPCGSAKAAVTSLEKELSLAPLPLPADGKQLVATIKHLATQVKQNQAAGGLLLVQSGASAVVYANRCPSLRAILGTCLGTVDEGVKNLSANVLVIEHPWQTLMQTKNLVSRFVRAKRKLNEDVKRQLAELATCG